MNKEKLIEYISDSSKLNYSSLEELKFLLDEFPYFQTGWILYAKNLNDLKDVRFEKKLKLATIYIPDRKKLAKLLRNDIAEKEIINSEKTSITEEIKEEKKVIDAEKILIENIDIHFETEILEENNIPNDIIPEGNNISTEIITNEIIDSNELIEIKTEVEIISEVSKSTADSENNLNINSFELNNEVSDFENIEPEDENISKFDLIDKFLSSNPKIIPNKDYTSANSLTNYSKPLEDEELFSETLAKIYVKQAHFEKAILTYEKLCLKYPEKNIYFASQIKKIEELIKNKKN